MLEKIHRKGKEVLVNYVDVLGGVVIPVNLSLSNFYKDVKIEMRTCHFPLEARWERTEKKSSDKPLNRENLIGFLGENLDASFL